jgi:Ser/Thr protein kinase RdoA (MazF antagonist)
MKLMQHADGALHPALEYLIDRMRTEQSFSVAEVEPIDPGVVHNNRLYQLQAVDGQRAVVKCYFRDDRHRLEREYDALSLLQVHGIKHVPKPLMRDDPSYAAVYSFEEGVTGTAANLTIAALEELAELVATLRRIRPGQPGATFRSAVPAAFSVVDGITRMRARLDAFRRFASSTDVYPVVRVACESWDPAGMITGLLDAIVRDIPQVELEAVIPESTWGFAQGDLAPHNVLVRPGGHISLLDFEYSGWDDPVAPVAAFLTADTSLGLPEQGTAAFISAYREAAQLTDDEMRRFSRSRMLMELNWAAVHLSLLTPERIAPKRFADPQLDLDRHLLDQLEKLQHRLAFQDGGHVPLGLVS